MTGRWTSQIRNSLGRFRAEEDGVTTISFVLVFPIFMFFFFMTFESGMANLRQVMLERGVDLAVREVRIGTLSEPTVDDLRERICDIAGVIPRCESQLRIEMLRRDVRNWVPVRSSVQCVNRDQDDQDAETFDEYGNNELMYLRVCARIDPVLPTTGIGRRISNSDDAAAGGAFALVSAAAFVIEPFRADDDL